jgi:hypothetical protein
MTTRTTIPGSLITNTGAILVLEASDARLAPGDFPDALTVEGKTRAVTFWRTQRLIRDMTGEDVLAVIYDAGAPGIPLLHVLND